MSLIHNIALTFLPKVGSVLAQNLISYCGSAEKVFSTTKDRLIKIPGIGEERANAIVSSDALKKAEKEISFIESQKIEVLFYTDEKFPQRLRTCHDAPILLYYKGAADLNTSKIVAVVGTRKITDYGREMTKRIIEDFVSQDILVISGMAYGVDIQAHQQCVEKKEATVGVLGHGLDRMYPAQHKLTGEKMMERGGLLTEFSSQDEFSPHNFPQRNRIVAGMSDAVVVVESATEGGALITANIANSYNKEVFAVPGKCTEKYSLGTNFLIKTFKATMVESGKDVIEAMSWEQGGVKPKKEKQLTLSFSAEEQCIYQILQASPEMEIDKIVEHSNYSNSKVAAVLLEMEMNGILASLPGKRYRLIQC